MTETQSIRFLGTDGPVLFEDAGQVVSLLPEIFCNWTFEHLAPLPSEACLRMSFNGGKFHFASDIYGATKTASDPLNAACTLVAELAWARIRHEPGLLCFHGAAIEFDGTLVLFPNKRRAGKSTLTACLAAQGSRVFTDDYLPLRLEQDGRMSGVANGAAPRLRVPLPDDFSKDLQDWVALHEGPKNRQYLYLTLDDGQLAAHGETLPVSSIILLDRMDEPTPPRLEPVDSPEILRRLIYQNFSRSMNPARVLAMICNLTDMSNCLRLTYSNAEEAAFFLQSSAFDPTKQTGAQPSAVPEDSPAVLTTDNGRLQSCAYVRNPAVYERRYGGEVFAASADGPGLHHFDGVTTGIWNLLSEPITREEISDTLAAAFPGEPKEELTQAVNKIMQTMLKHRLIVEAQPE